MRTDVLDLAAAWRELCGWYTLEPGVLTDPQPRMLRPSQSPSTTASWSSGDISRSGGPPGPRLYPDGDDPDAFRIELPGFGSGTSQVVFSRGPAGDVTAMHLGVQPLTFRKLRNFHHPTPRAGGVLAAAGSWHWRYGPPALRHERAGSERPFGTGANDRTG